MVILMMKMAAGWNYIDSHYPGSTVLRPVSDRIGMPLDQVNFMASQVASLVFAVLYRACVGPEKASPSVRHCVSLGLGLLIGLFCFGIELLHLLIQATVCFLCMKFLPVAFMHVAVFVIAMGYLSIIHFHRAYLQDGAYYIDISGPLMVATEKITSLAFSLNDGCYKQDGKLTEDQRNQAVRKVPSVLEYFSYILYFQGLIVGPLSFFKDYRAFIEGTDVRVKVEQNGKHNGGAYVNTHKPSAKMAVLEKLAVSVFWLCWYVVMNPLFPEKGNVDAEMVRSHSFLYRTWYMLLSMFIARTKYYCVWILADAVCNASGFGFNGYDDQGRPKWDLITNVRIIGIEFATSTKTYMDNWNTQTTLWLRRVCYDRAPMQRTLLTFVLSALWHGCYAGFYFTFVFAAVFVQVGRKVRKHIRPYFLTSKPKKRFYDMLTWLGTQLLISYTVVPFTLLRYQPSVEFYNNCYWCVHIICVILIVLPWERIISFHSRDLRTDTNSKPKQAKSFLPNGIGEKAQ